ncbi:MAG: Gfo/Idh/MocA family protein [Thermodesulfobacteriota bacterium]
MRVSIIGAGRYRSGIGEYVAKYFHKNGAEIISILGRTEETSRQASLTLQKYGIKATSYTDFDEMVEKERPEAVAICSPAATHYGYLVKSVERGLHIFCEKPFVSPDLDDAKGRVEAILGKAKERGLTVAMNSQWPFALKYYEKICGEIEIKRSNRFFIILSPFASGKEMIPEAVPHVLSLLYSALGVGEISDLFLESTKEGEMTITLRYLFGKKVCQVLIRLIHKERQPREFQFGFNDRIVSRSLNLRNYDIYFNYGTRKYKIADPLDLSVRDFVKAVQQKREPFIGPSHIRCNMSLLKTIYDRYSTHSSSGEGKPACR